MSVVRNSARAIARLLPSATRDALKQRVTELQARRQSGDLIGLATMFGTDKWGSHWYAQHYQHHFEAVRLRPLVVIEVGIGGYDNPSAGGESLRAWKYFFPNSQIVGIDLYDKAPHREERIRTYQGSQADEAFLRSVIAEVGRPDIIIDDGSHLSEHVIETFRVLFPLLKDDGIYAVEDTQSSYWPTWGGELAERNRTTSSMGFLKSLVDGLNHQEFLNDGYAPSYNDRHITALHFYHNLVFVQKGVNDEGSNMVTNGVLRT